MVAEIKEESRWNWRGDYGGEENRDETEEQ